MAILGDGRGGIFCENSLETPTNWGNDTQNMISLNAFDVILTNPPYGSKLKVSDTHILSQYDLGYQWRANKATSGVLQKTDKQLLDQTPQVLFIERCLDLLKEGGRLGIVAPESMFCNPSHKYIMNYVESRARIDAVISMPENLFQPHTHAKTCVVLMSKYKKGETLDPEHKIFMAVAKWCGHDSRGLEIPYDDIPKVQERYEQFVKNKSLDYDHLGFCVSQKQIVDSIYLPIYYNPEIRKQLDSLEKKYELVRISDLVEKGLLTINTGDEVGKLSYGTGQIPFIRTSDIANWEIKLDPKQGLSEQIYQSLKEK